MKNKDLILLLVDKSANAFGTLMGMTEDTKLKATLSIIQDTIKTAFDIDSNLLTTKTLSAILVKDQFDIDQASLLTNLLWTQGEILLKLNQPVASLTSYENTLFILQWLTHQDNKKNKIEKKNNIAVLIAAIDELKLTKNKLNYN